MGGRRIAHVGVALRRLGRRPAGGIRLPRRAYGRSGWRGWARSSPSRRSRAARRCCSSRCSCSRLSPAARCRGARAVAPRRALGALRVGARAVDDPQPDDIRRPRAHLDQRRGRVGGRNCRQIYYGAIIGLWDFPSTASRPAATRPSSRPSIAAAAALHPRPCRPGAAGPRRPAPGGSTTSSGRREMRVYEASEGRPARSERLGRLAVLADGAIRDRGAWLLQRRRQPLAILLAPVVMVTLTALLTYGSTRFRFAAEPSIVVLAAVAVDALAAPAPERWHERPARLPARRAARARVVRGTMVNATVLGLVDLLVLVQGLSSRACWGPRRSASTGSPRSRDDDRRAQARRYRRGLRGAGGGRPGDGVPARLHARAPAFGRVRAHPARGGARCRRCLRRRPAAVADGRHLLPSVASRPSRRVVSSAAWTSCASGCCKRWCPSSPSR